MIALRFRILEADNTTVIPALREAKEPGSLSVQSAFGANRKTVPALAALGRDNGYRVMTGRDDVGACCNQPATH